MKHLSAILLLAVIPSSNIVVGCGDNLFSSLEKKDDKQKGKSALQDGDYDTAIDNLSTFVQEHPEDTQARSMLATAYLKKSGVDELQLAAKITDAANGGSNDWRAIVSVMPGGSQQNIDSLQGAVDTLSAIPAESRTPDQNYQLALASSSLAVAVVKKNTSDENGNYAPTAENVAQMSDADAATVIAAIATTSQAAAGVGSSSTGLDKLSTLSTQISTQAGSTDKEKLQAYILSK